MKQFVLIEQDGYGFVVNEGDTTLSTLQTLVDGLIECVAVPSFHFGFPVDLWVNEEGLFREDFLLNIPASQLAGRPIVGPAVIARSNANGETLGLTEGQLNKVRESLIVDTDPMTIEQVLYWRNVPESV